MKGKTRKQLRKIIKVMGYRFAPHMDHFAATTLDIAVQTVMEEKEDTIRYDTCLIKDGKPGILGSSEKRELKAFADGYSAALREFISILEKK